MSLTRRQILRGCSTLIGAVAGCTGLDSPESTSNNRSRRSDDASATVEPGSVDDPATVVVRNPTGERVLLSDRATASRSNADIVASREGVERATEFAPGVPDDAAQAAQSFLEATSFEESAVYLFRDRVEECTRNRITSVSWTASGVDVEYCWEPRPSDGICAPDEDEEPTLTFVKIPAPLDPQSVTGIGTSGTGCQLTE